MGTGFSVISLIAYDYEFLLQGLPRYIDSVDEVILGLDKNRKTWAGNDFQVPDAFFEALKQIDKNNKIKIVEDEFWLNGQKPLDLDTRERNILSTHVRDQNWIISIDADEFVINFEIFLQFLNKQTDPDVCVLGTWMIVFKKLADSLLLVSSKLNGTLDSFPVATKKKNSFVDCRFTSQNRMLGPLEAVHYAYGRTEEALHQKLTNWGHKTDFAVESYFKLWQSLNEDNYIFIRNFHPLFPNEWVELIKVQESDLGSLDSKKLRPRAIAEAGSVQKFAKAFWLKHFG